MIFVSTSSVKDNLDLFKVLDTYINLGINNIELGSMHYYTTAKDLSPIFSIKKEHGLNFTTHCVFPGVGKKIFINPASLNPEMLKETLSIIKNSIEFARKIDAVLYGFHAGYRCDFDIDMNIISDVWDENSSYARAIDTVQLMADYTKGYGIDIAVENMPSRNRNLLFTRKEHFEFLFDTIKNKNLKLLVDLGHLQRTSNLDGIDMRDFICSFEDKIAEFHIHKVIGQNDHLPLTDSSVRSSIPKELLKKACLTLEGDATWSEQDILNSLSFIA